jgi:regulatory protein
MDSVARAADSSSASADSRISIRKTEWASAGILKVYPEEGPSFFVRPRYFNLNCPVDLETTPIVLDVGASAALYHAARSFLAERAALSFLARSEHCRFQLSLKLRKKGYSDSEIFLALEYLEADGSLDDNRFAEAWLRNRLISHREGKKKLLAALRERGVKWDIAESAVSAFFETVDERDSCLKAAQKLLRLGKTGEKLGVALMRKGFSSSLVKECLKTVESSHHVE